MEKRYSARETQKGLKRFLRVAPRHFFPPEAKVPVALDKRIADSRIERGVRAGKERTRERKLDRAAHRRAGIKDRASNEEDVRMPELFQWVPWFEELA